MKPLVLCYHRIGQQNIADNNKLIVTVENFRNQLEHIKKHFELISADEIALNPHDNSVAITFDDGFLDNYTVAAPILADLDIPASFFISTRFMKENVVLYPESFSNIYNIAESSLATKVRNIPFFQNLKPGISYQDALKKLTELPVSELWNVSVQMSDFVRAENLVALEALPMGSRHVEEIAQESLFTVGVHTATHPRLIHLSEIEIAQQMSESLNDLGDLGVAISELFPIPFGQPTDFRSQEINQLYRSTNMQSMSTSPKLITSSLAGQVIPRLSVQDWDLNYFKRILKYMQILSYAPGLTHGLMRLRRTFTVD